MKSFFKFYKLFKKLSNNQEKEAGFMMESPLFKYAIIGGIGLILAIIILTVLIAVIFGPVMLSQQYIEDSQNEVARFFEKVENVLILKGWCTDEECEKKAEQKYYEKLNDIYNKYKEKNVEIDVQLITATMFYGNTINDNMFIGEDIDDEDIETEDSEIHLSDIKKLASNMVTGSRVDYTKYKTYLINTYIPKRFSYMYEESKNEEKAIERIADEIMMFASLEDNKTLSNNCSFNEQEKQQVDVDKNYIENIQINTLLPYYHNFYTENASENDIEYTISLKEYVTGVVYREIHAGINPMSDETIKANLIAIKSYTLDRHPVIEKNGKYYINMRNNTDDQVYCNLVEGCNHYSKFGEDNLLGPALTNVRELLYRLYDETNDYFLYNTSEKKFIGEYRSTKALCIADSDPENCMSQNDSIAMGNNGNDYKAILMSFYTKNTGLLDINNLTVSTGAYACSKTSYMGGGKYSSNAPRYDNSSDFFANINYNYFKPTSYPWYGECPWYASGRAIEIMANSNIPDDLKNKRIEFLRDMKGNGADWYGNPSDELFSKSTDLYAAKPGSIISWNGGGVSCPDSPMGLCGHVGIIEDVEYDSNGKAVRALLSDGWNDRSRGYKVASYSSRWMDMESLKRYSTRTAYYFNGYVYLLD